MEPGSGVGVLFKQQMFWGVGCWPAQSSVTLVLRCRCTWTGWGPGVCSVGAHGAATGLESKACVALVRGTPGPGAE